MEDDSVAQFMSITDQNATVAAGYLSMTEGDVMSAVNMFFENPDLASSFNQQAPAAASSAPPVPTSSRPQPTFGREDSSGVIHIDDDDDDEPFDIPDDDDDGTSPHALQRIAQESDDAAMAQRLQEEMYSQNATTTDGVRAPIARTTETLVAPTGYGGMEEDDYGHVLEQMRRRNRPDGKRRSC